MNIKLTPIYQYFTNSKAFTNSKGFATPIAMGLGLMIMLAGTIALVRSQGEQVTSKIQRNNSRSLSAAQKGVARYQDLINQNKIIATYPACTTSWNNDTCQDGSTAISWAKASNIPAINPACPNTGATTVASATTQSWNNVSATDASLGQYRLFNYTFDNTTNTGKLVVEGRVNSSTQASTATTSLQVELPIQPGITNTKVPLAPRFNSLDPAVWIGGNAVTAIGNLTVDGNILLSNANCTLPTGSGQPTAANLHNGNTQAIIADPRSLPNTPTIPATVNTVTNADITNATQLPRATDVGDGNNYYHYVVTNGLNLSNYTLKIRQGTKVILYVQGNVTLDGNVKINQETTNNSAYLEIYGTSTTTSINFTGTGQQQIKAFIHAPAATVKLNSSGLTVNLTGAIWVNDWNGVNGVMSITADDQYINYGTIGSLINAGTSRVVDSMILAPRSWDTKEVN